jgi:hypothetical protein
MVKYSFHLEDKCLLGCACSAIIKKTDNDSGTYCAAVLSSLAEGRHFPALAKKPFRSTRKSPDTESNCSKYKAAYFPGCVVDKVYPNIGEASMQVFYIVRLQTKIIPITGPLIFWGFLIIRRVVRQYIDYYNKNQCHFTPISSI